MIITTPEARVRFNNGGWLTFKNVGWGIFAVTGASENMVRYRTWHYYEEPPKEKAKPPHIDLFDGKRFWYIAHCEVVGIDPLTWC